MLTEQLRETEGCCLLKITWAGHSHRPDDENFGSSRWRGGEEGCERVEDVMGYLKLRANWDKLYESMKIIKDYDSRVRSVGVCVSVCVCVCVWCVCVCVCEVNLQSQSKYNKQT